MRLVARLDEKLDRLSRGAAVIGLGDRRLHEREGITAGVAILELPGPALVVGRADVTLAASIQM